MAALIELLGLTSVLEEALGFKIAAASVFVVREPDGPAKDWEAFRAWCTVLRSSACEVMFEVGP